MCNYLTKASDFDHLAYLGDLILKVTQYDRMVPYFEVYNAIVSHRHSIESSTEWTLNQSYEFKIMNTLSIPRPKTKDEHC
jgi:hypothetical protein